MRIAYYITGHGFGHLVRSAAIIRCLKKRPGLSISVISGVPSETACRYLWGLVEILENRNLDVGLMQQDSVAFDLQGSLTALQSLRREETALVEREEAFLASNRPDVVVSDVAFLPIRAAVRARIPSVVVGNFTWDWIYRSYAENDPGWEPIREWIRDCYADADLCVKLPFGQVSDVFPRRVDVSVVANKSSVSPDLVRRAAGVDRDERLVLVAFGQLQLSHEALARLDHCPGIRFLYRSPLAFPLRSARRVDDQRFAYVDLVNASSAVITEPGYGIVSDCLSCGTPLVYTDRGEFAEYPYLVDAIVGNLPSVHCPQVALREGAWVSYLEDVMGKPRRSPAIALDGAEECAEILVGMFS